MVKLYSEILDKIDRNKPEIASKIEALYDLYEDWNQKINLISRKDFNREVFFERHILSSLTIAYVQTFEEGQKILDLGTGGGFPGVPLSIVFPEVNFFLVDSIQKKINVIDDVKQKLDLQNVRTKTLRAEQLNEKFDHIITRAVASYADLKIWTKGKYKPNACLIALKGGDVLKELSDESIKYYKIIPITDFVDNDYYKEKYIVIVPAKENHLL